MNIVYTAITAGYDKLREPKVITPGWQYICFTDGRIKSDLWDVKTIRLIGDAAKMTKKIKILNHTYAPSDVSIWVDGSVEIIGDLDAFLAEIPCGDLVIPKHPHRETLKGELEACIALKKDNPDIMREQVSKYGDIEYKFTQNTVIVRRGDVRKAMMLWWDEVDRWSKRDQLSFSYAMRQAKQAYETYDWKIVEKYFVWHKSHK